MSGQVTQDEGSWMDSILQDMAQSSCEPSNVQIQLKRIKSVAKRGDSQVETVFTAVWEALRSHSSMMRLAALHVCNELFTRSKHFRHLLMDNKFPVFVEQVVAPGKSLPAPKEAAKTLLEMALKSIQQWTQRFGRHHVELTIAHKYLRDLGMIHEDISQSGPEAQLASSSAPETHQPSNQPQAESDANGRVQKLIDDISSASMTVRVCMQCVAALLENLGHDVPKRLSQPPVTTPPLRTGGAHEQQETPASDPTEHPQDARQDRPADGHAATQSDGEEELEFEDVDWQERAAGAAAVADTMAVATPQDPGTQPNKRRLPRRIRAALVTALRQGQKAMQTVHMPEVAALRAAVADTGADEAALTAAAASGGAAAVGLPSSWRAVEPERLRVAVALPELQADARDLLGLLATAPELAEEDAAKAAEGAGAGSSSPRKRVLRGRNERDWPDLQPQKVPSSTRIRDPAAPNPHDPYTITAAAGGRPAALQRGPPARPASSAEPREAPGGPSAAAENSGRTTQPGNAAEGAKKSTMSKEAIERLAAKAPVLPPGDYLKLWDSYEAQMEFVRQHMRQGQVYSHWGRVDEDMQLDRAHIETLLAQRAVFHDSLADAEPRPRAAATAAAPTATAAAAAAAGAGERARGSAGSGSEPGPQTAAEFRAAARAHNIGVLAQAGVREVGTIDGGAGGGATRGKKRGRGSEGGMAKLRGVMRKMSRGARR